MVGSLRIISPRDLEFFVIIAIFLLDIMAIVHMSAQHNIIDLWGKFLALSIGKSMEFVCIETMGRGEYYDENFRSH